MTLDEKLGQMTQICFSNITLDGTKTLDLNADLFREAILSHKVGSFLSGTGPKDKWVNFITEVQRIAIEESRLGIPLLIGIDHVHGANYVDEGTIFPHNLTLSCSFDTSVIRQGAEVVAKETAPLGLSWNFAPVLDVGKNPYWPRLYETFGEDPLVCGTLGSAFVDAYQNANTEPFGLAACAKHFIGYSDPKSGWDRTPAEIPDQILYEQFLPSFEMALKAGVKTVMVNSGEVNGEPVHGSKFYIDEILRQRMGFDGVILTDIKDISKMVDMHSAYGNYKDAVLASINAGIDMAMTCNHYDFAGVIKELIEEGRLSEARIDESVKRILQLKKDLNLFEHAYPAGTQSDQIGHETHYEIAKRSAAESIVLLKNDGILPLKKDQKVFLAGFAAHSRKMMNGPWTLEWLGAEEDRHRKDVPSLYEAFCQQLGMSNVTLGALPFNFNRQAIKDIEKSDVVVLTIGEEPYSEFKGNIGDLSLDAAQTEMIKQVQEMGKPLVLLLVAGRPRIIKPFMEQTGAVLFCGYPGHGGPEAITEILAGTANPSGKLSFTYPANVGYFSPYYHKYSEYHHSSSKPFVPQFEFGAGQGYSPFEYTDLQVSDTLIQDLDQVIHCAVNVKNLGSMDGKETVLWFIRDEIGTITRPVKQLKHFEKQMRVFLEDT
ncbi:MAG: glycoside hydrolase family 3 N-terminal domain-containing protein, partial [Bacteroidota bacterium]